MELKLHTFVFFFLGGCSVDGESARSQRIDRGSGTFAHDSTVLKSYRWHRVRAFSCAECWCSALAHCILTVQTVSYTPVTPPFPCEPTSPIWPHLSNLTSVILWNLICPFCPLLPHLIPFVSFNPHAPFDIICPIWNKYYQFDQCLPFKVTCIPLDCSHSIWSSVFDWNLSCPIWSPPAFFKLLECTPDYHIRLSSKRHSHSTVPKILSIIYRKNSSLPYLNYRESVEICDDAMSSYLLVYGSSKVVNLLCFEAWMSQKFC